MHTCVKCQKELKWQAFSAEVRKHVFIQKCLKKIEADACVCIVCADKEDGKKRKAEHCVPRNDFVCSRTGCNAILSAAALTQSQRNHGRNDHTPILCEACLQQGYLITCMEDWPCARTGCTVRIFPAELTESQRNHVTSHGHKVMCRNCLKAGFTLRTPDPVKCNAVKCGKLLPRSKLDAKDVKTEKKRKDAICSECKKGDRKSGKRKSMRI